MTVMFLERSVNRFKRHSCAWGQGLVLPAVVLLALCVSSAIRAEKSGWDAPVMLRDGGSVMPLKVYKRNGRVHVLYLRQVKKGKIQLESLVSSDLKKWKKGLQEDLGLLTVLPAVSSRGDSLDVITVDSKQEIFHLEIDLNSGESNERPIYREQSANIDNRFRVSLIGHKNRMLFLFAEKISKTLGRAHLLESKDGGRTWRKVVMPDRKFSRKNYGEGRPILFTTRALMHFFVTDSEKGSHLVHYIRPLNGADWQKLNTNLRGSKDKLVPLGGTYNGKHALVLYGHQTQVFAATSSDGGFSWTKASKFNMAAHFFFTAVAASRNGFALMGVRKTKKKAAEFVVRLSGDGGKTWRDTGFRAGPKSDLIMMPVGSFSRNGRELFLIYLNIKQLGKEGELKMYFRRFRSGD